MVDRSDSLADSSLRFFGEMSAANAHEIKNALAVINENAGLLEDLVALADHGASLDHARLKKIARAIKHQVARADHIAKSSNRFSHSVDRGHGAADLKNALTLIADMATRFANLRDVHLDVVIGTESVTVHVKPFILLHLLWICLHDAIKACKPGQVLSISYVRIPGAIEIRYGPLPDLDDGILAALHRLPELAPLLAILDAAVDTDNDAASLRLTIKVNHIKR